MEINPPKTKLFATCIAGNPGSGSACPDALRWKDAVYYQALSYLLPIAKLLTTALEDFYYQT